jgi:murein DD-endopeptidase MepM/ murein hydrolase activator NlpD
LKQKQVSRKMSDSGRTGVFVMALTIWSGFSGIMKSARGMVRTRDLFVHDGATMRRIHISVKSQIAAIVGLALVGTCGVAGAAGIALSAPSVSKTIANYAQRSTQVSAMEDRVEALQLEVDTIRKDARARAEMLGKRQAVLATMLKGAADPNVLAGMLAVPGQPISASQEILAAYAPVDAEQVQMAAALRAVTDARYQKAATVLGSLGIDPNRSATGGMGGPFEPVTAETKQQPQAPAQADPQFRALFNSWKRLDQAEQTIGGIPSLKPIAAAPAINSGFGVRSDPFLRRAAMHAGVDMPGPIGTQIFATADGIVGRAGRAGGYGNLIELDHGRGVQTRYGHLSAILVQPGTRIKRGQLIGLMGSTGRSTGSHLHYEVRIDGRAVNPIPFLQSGDYLLAVQRRTQGIPPTAMGGPAKAE